jgi:mannose-6-phosphate isomerase
MDSWAAQYALATPSLREKVEQDGGIKPTQPYGEIWLVRCSHVPFPSSPLTFPSFLQGSTHENGPSYIEGKNQSLKDLVQQNPQFYLGEKLLQDGQMSQQYHNNLPYLFKVLSFDKPLPLQCHPEKHLGEQVSR